MDQTKRAFLRAAGLLLAEGVFQKRLGGKWVAGNKAPAQKVVLVIFGGVRHAETVSPQGLVNIPHLAKDLLPQSIVGRGKAGFPTPWPAWLAGARFDQIEQTLTEPRSLNRNLFQPEAIRRVFAEHRARRRDHADRFWRLLNLELWHRVFIDRDPKMLAARDADARMIPVLPRSGD